MLVFAVLAAFLLQNFQTATHIHGPAPLETSFVSGHDAAKQPLHRRAPVEPGNACAICHAASHAGQYLASAPILFAPAASGAVWLFTPAFRNASAAPRSHAWNSRAPPQ